MGELFLRKGKKTEVKDRHVRFLKGFETGNTVLVFLRIPLRLNHGGFPAEAFFELFCQRRNRFTGSVVGRPDNEDGVGILARAHERGNQKQGENE